MSRLIYCDTDTHTTSDQWSNWWASVGQASVLIKLVLGKHGYNWASQVWGGKSLRNPHICAREVSLECYPCNLFLDICSHSTHELYFLDTWNWRPKNSLKWSNQPKIRQNYTLLEQKWVAFDIFINYSSKYLFYNFIYLIKKSTVVDRNIKSQNYVSVNI